MGRSPWRAPYGSGKMPASPVQSGEPMQDGCECSCTQPLAIVTSPVQCWQNLYTPCEALSMGTLFRDLNLPLVGCPTAYRKGGCL